MVVPRLLRVASFRFAALYVVVFAASALVLGATVFFQARSALQQQMTARIENEVGLLTEGYRSYGLPHLIQAVAERERGGGTLDYLLQNAAGARLAGSMPDMAGLKPGWTTIAVPLATDDPDGSKRIRALTTDLGGGVLLAVGHDQRQIEKLEDAVTRALVWTVGVAGALGIAGGALVSHAFLRRVDMIARAAETIIGGDLGRRVPLRGTGDDFDRLAGTLNRMLDRIAVLMDSLRQVSADVAHNLRTPLTRLYQRLEDMRAHARSTEHGASIDAALAEAQALLETFSALLRIAQVEGGSPRSRFARVDFSALVERVADAYRLDAEQGGHQLISTIARDLFVSGDQELLTQAVANLVENALRHTPAGTRIDVCLQDRGEAGVLTIEDDGPGVAEAELPRLTDRFYRGQHSLTAPGNGLGLSLVSAIAELHGATLRLSAMSLGFRATMVIPRRNSLPTGVGKVCGGVTAAPMRDRSGSQAPPGNPAGATEED